MPSSLSPWAPFGSRTPGPFAAFAVTQVTGNTPLPGHDADVEHEADAKPLDLNPANPE